MSSISVPEEAASHLRAILLAFNRDIFASLLDEADELAVLGQTNAAVLIAGTVAEYLARSPGSQSVSIEYRTQIESWRALRNQAVHSSAAITTEQARSMVQNIREFGLGGDSGAELSGDIPQLARSIKGKYAHIRTSTNEFIARKRDDLELEDR